MSNSLEGEEVQYYADGQIKRGVVKDGVIIAIQPTDKKKGTKKMAKKEMTKQTEALTAWREAHRDKNGKVIIPRRSSVAILAELKKKRATLAERLQKIDTKIRYFDSRVNSTRRKELVSKLTTEQLEHLVRMNTISTTRPN